MLKKNASENKFFIDNKNINFQDIVSRWRPGDLFEPRGRTEVKNKIERHDIGIMDKETQSNLKEPNHFTIPELSKDRPLFRTFINDKTSGKSVSFIEKIFDKDEPLVGAISGSASCIMVASELLKRTEEVDKKQLSLSAAAFLVGGGYHSQAEVMEIALPGMTMHDGIKEILPKARYEKYLSILNREIEQLR